MNALGKLFYNTIPIAILGVTSTQPHAQGRTDYCNFESPQVKPIAVANIGNRDFLLTCNTPDNSVEVYDIQGALRDSPAFRARIPVGLEPVSIAYHYFGPPINKHMLYAVNWLGDSVTFVELSYIQNIQPFTYKVITEVSVTDPREAQVGPAMRGDDEPVSIAIMDSLTNQFLIVTKRTASSYSLLDPLGDSAHPFEDVVLPGGSIATEGGRNVIMTSDGQIPWNIGYFSSNQKALKEPHTVAIRPNHDEFWVLAHQGGGSKRNHGALAPDYDFDLWGTRGVGSSTPAFLSVTGLGTTNFNMAFDKTGNFLYVVGTDAFDDVAGNNTLNTAPTLATGFVRTMLYRIDISTLGTPIAKDLNSISGPPGANPVSSTDSLAHATDVAVYTRSGVDYLCIAAFNSDNFALVDFAGNPANPDSWIIKRLNVGSPIGPSLIAGPRGLAVLETGTTANHRVYILNRLDNSISIMDPNPGNPVRKNKVPLQKDPRPTYIRRGQAFLYSRAFSGLGTGPGPRPEGFVACASCHVDGRSDQLQWRLSTSVHGLIPALTDPRDALEIGDPTAPGFDSYPDYPNDVLSPDGNGKGPMITQSLQGLLNLEVGDADHTTNALADPSYLFEEATNNPFDDLVSNAPYHWRGDKENFRHFNEAFANLQGMAIDTGSAPQGGLTTEKMKDYEEFINSIHYPPNPLQKRTREYDGSYGTLASIDPADGAGAKLGLKLFHTLPTPGFDGRSCVQCHFLPEGSNNRLTCVRAGADPTNEPTLEKQPLETPALRGLTQKEARLELDFSVPPIPGDPRLQTGDLGLGHEGLSGLSRNEFHTNLRDSVPAGQQLVLGQQLTAINLFSREIDNGIAPIVGRSVTVFAPGANADIDEIENEANKANCGIAVYARIKSGSTFVDRGYWYKYTGNTAKYKQVGQATELDRATILALLNEPGELMIFRATPLGSERRVATLSGSSDSSGIASPSNVAIIGTTPNSAYVDIPTFERNWDPNHPTLPFNWLGNNLFEPLSLRVSRTFQDDLVAVPKKHDAPRRLQVTGLGLLHGARIRLLLPNPGGSSKKLELPIYPTSKFMFGGGPRIWETAVEFDPTSLYTLMLGGPGDQQVGCVFDDNPCGARTIKAFAIEARNVGDSGWIAQGTTEIPYPTQPLPLPPP